LSKLTSSYSLECTVAYVLILAYPYPQLPGINLNTLLSQDR